MKASRVGALVLALLMADAAAPAVASENDEEIRGTIARWYEELAKEDEGRTTGIVTPRFIDASPPYDYIDNGSRALGPLVYTSLAARALQFTYRIRDFRRDASFARVQVDERGYFYAAATQTTYELAADTTFLLERSAEDGRWRIAAHRSASYGFHPSQATNPMPDLRELYYATEGKDRDPAKDAEEARNF